VTISLKRAIPWLMVNSYGSLTYSNFVSLYDLLKFSTLFLT
jgi:hypothetical protein